MMAKRGRPKKEEAKDVVFTMRLTRAQADEIEEAARIEGITRAELMLRGALSESKAIKYGVIEDERDDDYGPGYWY